MEDSRTAKAGMNFLHCRDTAGDLTALENERCKPRFRQIKRSDQTIVSRADDDDTPSFVGHQRFHSLRIFFAALSPGAPMMPPPGCVADPHMYRFRIGVRYCAQPGTGRRKKSCSRDSS